MFILKSTHQRAVSRLEREVSELKGRVDRAVHDETVRLLKERIGDLEQLLTAARSDLRAVQDTQMAYIFGQVLRDGKRTMFDPRLEQKEYAENEIPLPKTEEQERLSDVERARRETGSNDIRIITKQVERNNRKRYAEKLRKQGVPPDFEAAIEEGRKAATEATA